MNLAAFLKKIQVKNLIFIVIGLNLLITITMIFTYGNKLSVGSDDLGYIKTAAIMSETGRFVFLDVNEPTVYGTPFYPMFVAFFFKIFKVSLQTIQVVRVIQALLSSITLYLLFKIGTRLFDEKIALFGTALCGFYVPYIIAPAYIITESLFMPLMFAIIYFSFKMMDNMNIKNTVILGVLWAVTTLCRPTISLFPILLYFCLLFFCRYKIKDLFKTGLIMIAVFSVIMSPWWVRNYIQYGEFIPLSASDGNPMLQGTYIGYKMTPQNTTVYKLGKNLLETNRIEVQVAKRRMQEGFRTDFWGYLKWYTIDKIRLMWVFPFFWQRIFNISINFVTREHNVMLIGFCGMFTGLALNFRKYFFLASFPVYFTVVHLFFMTFDRYAFPTMPVMAMFSSFFMVELARSLNWAFGDIKPRLLSYLKF